MIVGDVVEAVALPEVRGSASVALQQIAGGVEEGLGRGDVRRALGADGVAEDALAVDQKLTLELEGVAADPAGQMAAQDRADKGEGDTGTGDLPYRSFAQTVGAVRGAVGIDEDGVRQLEAPLEPGGLRRCALADGDDVQAGGSEPVVIAAQLRRMLAAERSAEVAEKDERQTARRARPERTQAAFVAGRVAERDVGRGVAGLWP